MQSIVLPPSSFINADFGHPRFDPTPERFSFNFTRSTNARRCSPRELPPPRPMSGTVQTEDPLETSGNVRRSGHHAGHSQPVTAAATTTTEATLSGVPGSILGSGPPANASTVQEPSLQRLVSAPGDESSRHPYPIGDPFPSRLPLPFGGPSTSQSSVPTFSQPSFGPPSPVASSRPLPQKQTRRTKAHVASACVNCKKKHLGCDPARPCRRCVLSGKEATCVDVTHKKRGRPPLKAEEATYRTYGTQMDNPAAGQHGPPRRTPMHRASSSRELRPMTDLQMPPGQAGGIGFRPAGAPPPRWPTTVYSHAVDPALSMQRNMGHRRFSSSGSVQSLTATSPTFVPMAGGYSPAMAPGRIPTVGAASRPLSSYANAALPVTSPQQYQQPFGVTMSPYTESTRTVNRLSMGDPSVPRDPHENFLDSPVRLPPIFPPTMASPAPAPHSQHPQSHRLSDPYPAVWSPRTREEFLQPEQRQHLPPQGFLDPISPQSQMRQPAPDLSYAATVPRHLEPVAPGTSMRMPPGRSRDEQPNESDTGDRPAKRRKMALDDMVND